MFKMIRGLLNPDEVRTLMGIAKSAKFLDGKISNPHTQVKDNLQLDANAAEYQQSAQIMGAAYARNEEFQNFAFPRVMCPPMLCKYDPGHHYGPHPDRGIITVGQMKLRSDVSSTIFLAEPESYDGGELSVQVGERKVEFKGFPGDAIVYPSWTMHEVKEVTRGQRIVAITFIQSFIPDHTKREMLYELGEVSALEGNNMKFENRSRMEMVRQNLIRMWSDC